MHYTGKLIWVEGIIGAGKTTFCQEISSRLNYHFIQEPAPDHIHGNPYLDKFYQDPKTYSFPMQIFLLHRRYMMQKLAADEATGLFEYDGAMLDRSISGDLVFAKMLADQGLMSQLDYQTYLMCHSSMCRTLHPPSLMIFLDVSPQTAFARMRKRARAAESDVSLDYLSALHKGYQKFLDQATKALYPWAHSINILKLPWDPETNTKEAWDSVAQKVQEACNHYEK